MGSGQILQNIPINYFQKWKKQQVDNSCIFDWSLADIKLPFVCLMLSSCVVFVDWSFEWFFFTSSRHTRSLFSETWRLFCEEPDFSEYTGYKFYTGITWYAIRVCEWYPDSRKVWPGAKSQAWIDENFCPSPSEVYPPKSISDLYLTRYWSRVPPYILPTRSITYSLGHEKGTFRFSGKRKLDCEYRK